MTWKRRLAALTLAVTMLFTACGAQQETQTQAQGRFVETQITPPDEPLSAYAELLKTPDGIVIIDWLQPTPVRWDSSDLGETWRKSELSWYDAQSMDTLKIAALWDGSLLAVKSTITASDDAFAWRIQTDGTVTPLALEALKAETADGKSVSTSSIQPIGTDRFAVFGSRFTMQNGVYSSDRNTSLFLYDAKGTLIREITCQSAMMTSNKTHLFCMDDNGVCTVYDEDGNIVSSLGGTYENLLETEIGAFLADENDTLYLCSGQGVKRLNPGGSLQELVMNGEKYSYGMPTSYFAGGILMDENCLVFAVQENSEHLSVYRYDWDAQAPTVSGKTLRVWSLDDSDLLRVAVNRMRIAYPDVDVQLEIARADQTSGTLEDIVRTLNTQIAAGSGPDVLILDKLSAQSFAENGLLADLTEVVDADALYPAFLQPFQTEKGIFLLPAQFRVELLAGSAEEVSAVDSLQSLSDLVAQGPGMTLSDSNAEETIPPEQRPVLYYTDFDNLFNVYWNACAPALITEDGVEQGALKDFLEQIRTIANHYGLESADGWEKSEYAIGFGNNQMMFVLPSSVSNYKVDRTRMAADEFENLSLLELLARDSSTGDLSSDRASKLLPGFCEGAWTPQLLTGISAGAQEPELAQAFVALLFSEQVQRQEVPGGMPTTKAGIAAQQSAARAQYEQNGLSGEMYPIDDLIGQLKTPVMTGENERMLVRDAALEYAQGKQSLEQTVQRVTQGLQLMLEERS